tara:strand:- start:1199 stop:2188 length:990 start_codon:yes stop_codon:yes gene_type:complete
MKTIITLTMAMMCLSVFGQKKLKFNKDIYPLIKTKAFEEAKPILQEFLKSNPNNLKGNYWLGVIYYGNVSYFDKEVKEKEIYSTRNTKYIDSSQFYLAKTRKLVSVLNLNPISARFFPDFIGFTGEELVADAIPKINDWLNLLAGIRVDWKEFEKKQNKDKLLRERYMNIHCKEEESVIEPEGEWDMGGTLNTKTCQWGNYYIVTNNTFDAKDCKFGCSEQSVYKSTINPENKIELYDILGTKQNGDSYTFFSGKFYENYNALKSDNGDCLGEIEPYFDIPLFYFKDGDKDGLTFGLKNEGVSSRCEGVCGETTVKVSFEEIVPFVIIR